MFSRSFPACRRCPLYWQVPLSFAGSDLSQMVVTWSTLNPTPTSTVQWGPAGSTNFPNSATGTNRSTWSRPRVLAAALLPSDPLLTLRPHVACLLNLVYPPPLPH